MAADNRVDDTPLMDLDLKEEAAEIEIGHGRIEERIRHIEAVVSLRARMRQSWRQSRNSAAGPRVGVVDDEGRLPNVVDWGNRNRVGFQKRSTCMVARALEMVSDTGEDGGENGNGNYFDCNICFSMAREPILTCCGHLFCWACFFELPCADSFTKECPVCRGEVIFSTYCTLIPIYGSGSGSGSGGRSRGESEIECSMRIPPRPKPTRVDSIGPELIRLAI